MEGKENANQNKIQQTHGYTESSEPDLKIGSLQRSLTTCSQQGEERGAGERGKEDKLSVTTQLTLKD